MWQDRILERTLQDLDGTISEEKLDERSKELSTIIEENQLESNVKAW